MAHNYADKKCPVVKGSAQAKGKGKQAASNAQLDNGYEKINAAKPPTDGRKA